MPAGDALILTLAIVAALWLVMDRRPRKHLFGAVLTKGKKGVLGLTLTPLTRKKKSRRRKRP